MAKMADAVRSEPKSEREAARVGARRVRWLWLCGAGMLVPLGYSALRYPLRGWTTQLVDIGKLSHYEWPEFTWYTGGLVVMFALYLLALRETRRLPVERALPAVFGVAAVLGAAMAWMYPVNAIDIFIYAARSRLFTHYGVNPNLVQPIVHWNDPYLHYASQEWAVHVSPYGPLWNLIAYPTTWIGGSNIGIALAGFKVLAFVSYLACGGIIVWALRTLRPSDAATGALLFLWNPLVLWEGVGNGHNDIVLAVPLLLAGLAWIKRWDRVVIPLLVVAALIKYVTVLLIPIAAIAVWRRAPTWAARARLVAWTVGLSLFAALVAFIPFSLSDSIRGVRTSINDQGTIFLTSPAAMAIGLLQSRYAYNDIVHWAKTAGELIVAAVMLWQAARVWDHPRRVLRAMFEVLFVFLLVATWNFRPWYLIWPVAVAALLPLGWVSWRIIAWTAGGLAMYSLFIWGWQWWDVHDGHQVSFYRVQNVGVPLILTATLLLTLAEIVVWVVHQSRARSDSGPAVLGETADG